MAMEQFVVSARKYRPKRFTDVVGQQGVTITLRNALKSGHLAQSFLFCGPRGVGKTTNARILAKAINCLNPSADFEPCGECASCKAFEQNTSFNIHELDAASNNSVEDIRDLVAQVRIPPQNGKYKVYIIDEVHMLSAAAFNAFLKTLEEPPSYAIFILATTEKHKIIPTILSRCQIYEFNRITVHDTVEHLKEICKTENITADNTALHIIAQKADGALRDALSMFDRLVDHVSQQLTLESVLVNLNILDYDYYFRFVDYFLMQDLANTMLLFDEVQRKGFEGDLLINGLCEHFRNLLMCKDTKTADLIEASGELRARYLTQMQLSSASFLLTAMNLANQCEINYKTAKNKRLHVELCLMKISQLPALFTVSQGNLPDVKKNSSSEPIGNYTNTAAIVNLVTDAAKKETRLVAEREETTANTIQPEIKNSIQQEPEKPVVVKTPAPKKNLSSLGVSISSIENKIEEDEKAKKEDGLFVADTVPQETLLKAWHEYAKEINKEKANIASIFRSYTPLSVDGAIKVTVNIIVQKHELEHAKQHFLDFLKERFNIKTYLIIEVEKEADNSPLKKAYTQKEKIEMMIQKNPHVLTLIQQLDLK